MIFHPQNSIQTNERFVFSGAVHAVAHPCLHKSVLQEFWHNFSLQCSTLTLSPTNEFRFSLGTTPPISTEGAAYSIHIDAHGVCLCANSEKDLLLGFMTLLDRFRAVDGANGEDTVIRLDGMQLRESPRIPLRMVHFCIFPETSLWELQRFLRFCAALKYSHVVLEFWGMLRFDCLRELSWSHAFSKEELRPILREANDLGLEIVPMFNHWGHASASRGMHGKHVVLDQNPRLRTYFREDGWCWEISKPRVRELLRRVREELVELCGQGSYFHIGCDEAFNFEFTKESMDQICNLINEVSNELQAGGRRAIAWGDMFLYRHNHYNPNNQYTCNAPSAEAEAYLLEHLSRDLLIADWQYNAPHAPVETAAVFRAAGFDCLLCPWDKGVPQLQAVVSTIKEQALSGLLHTTWHTLSRGYRYVLLAGVGGFEGIDSYDKLAASSNAASLVRRVMPCGGDYEKAGWSKRQIGEIWY